MEEAHRQNPVLSSAQFIAEVAEDVVIPPQSVEQAGETLFQAWVQGHGYTHGDWRRHALHPQEATQETTDWIFVVDTLNFSFWSPHDATERACVERHGTRYTGYWLLPAAVNRALEVRKECSREGIQHTSEVVAGKEGIPLTTPSFYRNISDEFVAYVFRSETKEEVPLLDQRAACLREVGRVLCDRYGGSFANVLRKAQGSARSLVEEVVANFPCFRDQCLYRGREVSFFKRAQILVADIWACFEGKEWGFFKDIDWLTMFADYRVPQALCHLGVLRYSTRLTERLQRHELFVSGDSMECEIRGVSIWVVECIRQYLQEKMGAEKAPNSLFLDFYLWEFAKRHADEMDRIPIHRVRCHFY